MLALYIGHAAAFTTDQHQKLAIRGVQYCQHPSVEKVNGSLIDDQTFPRKDFSKALQDDPKGEMLRSFIKAERKRLKKNIRSGCDIDYYPACQFSKMCKSATKVIVHCRVLDSNPRCWNIQPVIWTTCNPYLVEDFSCVDEKYTQGIGFRCLPDYFREPLWVYCDDRENPFRRIPVTVPFKCSVKKYCCPEEI